MKYAYFTAYYYINQAGRAVFKNVEIDLDKLIDSMDDIRQMEAVLAERNKSKEENTYIIGLYLLRVFTGEKN